MDKEILFIALACVCANITIAVVLGSFISHTLGECCMCGASLGCCPCPNHEYIDVVSEYLGYEPSSAGSWHSMCEQYKRETNTTFDCFR